MEKTLLYAEIQQQPEVLARLLQREEGHVATLAQAMQQRNIGQVVIAARGSSDNAGRYAQYVLGAHNGLQVALATPSLFSIYRQPVRFRDTLVLGISQSGRSPDIISVLAEARRQQQLTAALTNEPESEICRHADFVIDLGAGEEKSVAASKTYTAQLLAIAMLSARLPLSPMVEERPSWAQLQTMPDAVAQTLGLQRAIAQAAPRYRAMSRSVVIGRGFNYATAFEMALKMTELTYTVVEPYSSADFLHGPLALIEPGFPVFVVAPSGRMLPEMRRFVAALRPHQAEIITLSDDEALLAAAALPFKLPVTVPEWLSPLTAIVPGQLFALSLACARGYDVDRPRALRKVTRTR